MTGRMPTSLNRSTSLANCSLRSACSMAAPPYLMTRVLPWKARMYGSASSSTSARCTIAFVSVSTRPPRLENVPREVLVLENGSEVGADIVGVDGHPLVAHVRRAEGHFFEQLLHHRVEPPRPDVLSPLVDRGSDIRHRFYRVLSELQRDTLRLQELDVLTDEGVPRLGQDADKILPRQGLQLHPDGEAPLELGDEIRRLGHVKRARRDEENMIGPDHAVLRGHRRAFDDGEQIALHPFPRDVGPVGAFLPRHLVQLIEEDDAGVLHAANSLAHRLVHVHQLLRF